MSRLPRPTVRARLTLLYTVLSALCGAIIVAVSYALVAHVGVAGQGPRPAPAGEVPAAAAALCRSGKQGAGGFPFPGECGSARTAMALCRSAKLSVPPEQDLLARCQSYFQLLGAQDQRDLTLSRLLEYSLITLAVVIALAALLGWLAAGRALRPVQQITAAARAASEHNLSARVGLRGPRDELSELAGTFDEMLGRLQAAFEGRQRFIANASHELRTPLAVMRTTLEVVLDNPESTPGELRGMAEDIRVAVDRAEHLIGALLLLARNERGLTVHEPVDLATVGQDVLEATPLGDRRLHAALEPAVVSGDAVLLERLTANLVDNAVRYNTAAGEIWVGTRTAAGGGQLTVANTGPLLSPGQADRIFRPFERLSDRAAHDGCGLGLAIVASIAAIHGGTVSACPRKGGGLSVTVTMPAAGAPAQTGGLQPGR